MQRLALTLPTPAENLALDEALLDEAEEENSAWEFLRIWESPDPFVVLGRASRFAEEVNEAACTARAIPTLRRSSGGAAIVAGPGCLMYAVVLSYQLRPELRDIGRAHKFVLSRMAGALQDLDGGRRGVSAPEPSQAGTSDLAIHKKGAGNLKFSGNSLRAKRTHLLYHGTLLYDFDLSLIATYLRMPPRQPAYRDARDHTDFVTNLTLSRADLLRAVDAAWPTNGELADWPRARVQKLVSERYSCDSWNLDYGLPVSRAHITGE